MKVSTVVALVAAGTAPMAAGVTVEWLGMDDIERVLHGENVTDVANDIARREFSPAARLVVVDTWSSETARGDWGGRVEADEDSAFLHVRVRVQNTGKLDMPVQTHHFSAIDDARREYDAEWGLADGFSVPRLRPGEAREGVVVFEAPLYATLLTLRWEGEFAEAEAPLAPGGASGDAPEPPPERRPDDAGPAQRPPPEEDPDDWDDW